MNLASPTETTGFTAGTFDLFHKGHVRLLQRAAALCDRLIVGVLTDRCVLNLKGHKPVFPYEERVEIIQSIRYVNLVVPCEEPEHSLLLEKLKFNVMFIGDDWQGKPLYSDMETNFAQKGVKVIYLPRTPEISSQQIKDFLSTYYSGKQTN